MTASQKKCHNTSLYFEINEYQWPIIYSLDYNISLCGLERLQSYDILKGKHIFLRLKELGLLDEVIIVQPNEAKVEDLLAVHSKVYLNNLKLTQFIEGASQWGSSAKNGLTDLPPVGLLPSFLVDSKILRPLRYQTGGTVLAAKLALERGWAINLGGGFHHCSAGRGGGFCAYADISMAVRFVLDRMSEINQIMIVDLDASQCNGPERDFLGDDRVYIFDMYNRHIYPQDGFAKRGIRKKIEMQANTSDQEYLQLLRSHLDEALLEFHPDLVLYIAGAAVLASDSSGLLSLSDQGLIERDQIVIQKMRTRAIPIAMILGGGYRKESAMVMTQSILNLYHLGLISGPDCPPPMRNPSPVPPRSLNDDIVSNSSMWSRFRSISVNNFAYLTAAVSSSSESARGSSSSSAPATDKSGNDEDGISDADNEVLLSRNEMSRCISLPNIDADAVGFNLTEMDDI